MPTQYLAIDVGSTSVTVLIIDLESKSVVGSASAANTADMTSHGDKKIGRSEWDLERMFGLAITNAAGLIEQTGMQPAASSYRGRTSAPRTSCRVRP
jgi:sugar (pentulose or hexulose) kinase